MRSSENGDSYVGISVLLPCKKTFVDGNTPIFLHLHLVQGDDVAFARQIRHVP